MKKIGLCVCYDTKNYGSQLQVLATINAVSTLGYDYEIIRYKKKKDFKLLVKAFQRLFNPIFMHDKIRDLKKEYNIAKYKDISSYNHLRKKKFQEFADNNFNKVSPVYDGYNKLKESSNTYDAYLVGSDQLWTPGGLTTGFYTLMFVPKDKIKISYATSFGVSKIPFYQKDKTKEYLDRIQYISCRELKGTQIIKELTGRNTFTALDPTLLFSGSDWNDKIPLNNIVDYKYIFCYFLGNNLEHRKVAINLGIQKRLKIITLPFLDNFVLEDLKFGDESLYDIDAFDFVNLIRNAEYILTDSFHGSIFSILNHKKFMTFNRFIEGSKGSRNSRIDSLFKQLDMNDRRYNGEIDAIDKLIDYSLVDNMLDDMRKESIEFLTSSLSHV